MYKVAIYLNGKECKTEQLWETEKQAKEMEKLYQIFFRAQGAKNFTFEIVKVPD